VLMLSRFAGAARQLMDAIIVNPREIEGVARAMSGGLNMSREEQARRMRRMRSSVEQFNAYWWGRRLLRDAARLRRAYRSGSYGSPGELPLAPAMDASRSATARCASKRSWTAVITSSP